MSADKGMKAEKGMQKLLKQAQDMQQRMQRDLSETLAHGEADDGAIATKMNGHKQLLSIHIDPTLVDPTRITELQELVLEAINDVTRKMDETLCRKLGPHAATSVTNYL